MIAKLATRNIRKSIQDYGIYFFTLVITVAVFYVFNSLEAQSVMSAISAGKSGILRQIAMILWNLSVFISCVLGFLIIYANNFLIKRRKKEIWLYLLLGMSKKKVSMILALETMLVGCFSLVGGLLLGIGLSQLLSMFIIQLFQVDMTKFSFIFSGAAVFKTLLCFGITFLLVMVFNVRNLSKYKLIDLLTAHRKNETITIRNKKLTLFFFLLSLVLFVCAYFLLFSGGMVESLVGITSLPIALCGIVGTYLFFLSLADFFLSLVQTSKTFYFKGLRMFILRQLNNKISTNVVSMTVISLLLLLTIGILSSSISIASVFNTNIEQNNVSDFTLHETYYALGEPQHVDLAPFVNDETFQTYVKDFASYTLYESEDITLGTLLSPNVKTALREQELAKLLQEKLPLMKKSDFQRLMMVLNKPEYLIETSPQQYLLSANLDKMIAYYQQTLQEDMALSLEGQTLTPANKEVLVTALENSSVASNKGLLIVDDSLLLHSKKMTTNLVGNYLTSPEELEEKFSAFLAGKLKRKPPVEFFTTRRAMEEASIGIGATVSFIGLYIGIIFALCCVTILAIKQLSETSDNKERYQILRKLWTDEHHIKKSLFVQIGIYFLLPLSVAVIHSILTLPELNQMVMKIGDLDVSRNILLIIGFIVVVYGGYFLATYWCSLGIIKEKRSLSWNSSRIE